MTAPADQLPTDPVHQVLAIYPEHYGALYNAIPPYHQQLIRKVTLRSYVDNIEVEAVVSTLSPQEQSAWKRIADAFARFIDLMSDEDGGD